jgi:hypothetical protein
VRADHKAGKLNREVLAELRGLKSAYGSEYFDNL